MKIKYLFFIFTLLLAIPSFAQKSKVPIWLNLSAGSGLGLPNGGS